MSSYRDNPLDEIVNTELMRVCKCVVPYLDRNVQKNVAIGLKFLELINTINTYADDATLDDTLSRSRDGNWQTDLLHSVRENLTPEKAYIVDAIVKLQEVKSILNNKETSPTLAPTTFDEPAPFFDKMPDFHRDASPVEPPKPASSNNANSAAALLQVLTPLMDDNQKQIFNLLTTFLGNK